MDGMPVKPAFFLVFRKHGAIIAPKGQGVKLAKIILDKVLRDCYTPTRSIVEVVFEAYTV